MEKYIDSIITLTTKIYSTNKTTLEEFINDLKEILCNIKNENEFLKLEKIIINLNGFITEYKKKIDIEIKSLEALKPKISKCIMSKTKKIEEEVFGNGKYVGEMMDGKRNGKGTYYFKSGDIFIGEWKDDNKIGKGTYFYKEGDVFEGEYKNNVADGKGIYYYINGDIYDGEYYSNLRHGKGVYYFSNGSRYEGDWKKDKKDGDGVFYCNDGKKTIGKYINNNKVGKHITITKNGDVFTDNYI